MKVMKPWSLCAYDAFCGIFGVCMCESAKDAERRVCVVQMDGLNCWQVQTLAFSWQSNRWESASLSDVTARVAVVGCTTRPRDVTMAWTNCSCVQHQIATTCRTGDVAAHVS